MRTGVACAAVIAFGLGGVIIGTPVRATDEPCVRFYGEYDFKGTPSSCCTNDGYKMSACHKNDWAKSMVVYGPAGTVITLFDNPNGATGDDFFVLKKLDDEPVRVDSFEGDPTITGGEVDKFYSGGNGLDGKVSAFYWCDGRKEDCDTYD